MPATIKQLPATKVRAGEILAQIEVLQKELQRISGPLEPRLTLPELHAANGRIDAAKVAKFMAVPLRRLSEGLGLNYKAVHRSPSAESIQDALQPVKRSLEFLDEFFGPKETIRIWLNTPHPMLDDRTALSVILEGKAFAVERLLGNAREGVVS
jgi:hypothetical protein